MIAVIVGGIYALSRSPGSNLPPYLDICVSGAGRFYHAHPHLSIVVNGNPQPIPASVGRSPCLRPLHTHDTSGVIHVEPDDGSHPDYSLKDFFLIWGQINPSAQVFNSTYILGFKTDSTHSITMTVNAVPNTNLENYVLPRNACSPSELPQGQSCPSNTQFDIVITYGPPTSSL